MVFENAYQLYLYLAKHKLVKGFWVEIEGEFEIISPLKNQKIIKILHETLGRWYYEGDGHFGGYHEILYKNDDDLLIGISINEDITYNLGNPFEIENICRIVCDVLDLKSIDREEFMEYQICIDLELEFEDLSNGQYSINKLNIESFEEGELENELKNIRVSDYLPRLEPDLIQYILKEHNEFLGNQYQGFELSIKENYVDTYNGLGFESVSYFKGFMEDIPLSIKIELSDIF